MNRNIILSAALLAFAASASANGVVEPPKPAPAPAAHPAPAHTQKLTSSPAATSSASGGDSNSLSNSGASAGSYSGASTGPVSLSSQSGPVSSSTGPVTVAPVESSSSSTRALALSLPAPVFGGAPSAGNCLVAGNEAWAIGWNFGSKTGVKAFSDPVCTLRAAALEAEASCQFLTAARIRAHMVSIVAPGLSIPISAEARDLAPEQCLEARQPRVIQPAAGPQQQVVVSQLAAAESEAQAQPPAARPARPAAPAPKTCVKRKVEVEVCEPPAGGAK